MNRNNSLRSLIVILLAATLVTGCGGSGSMTTVSDSSAKTRNPAPIVAPSTESTVVNSVNTLGMNLLGQGTDNAVVAPFSASLTMAKLRAGAAGQTRTTITEALLLTGLGVDLDPAFNKIDLGISARIAELSLDGQPSRTSAEGWLQNRYGYLITYLDALAYNYGLKPTRTDYAADQYTATATIATWATLASGGLPCTFTASRDARLTLGDAVQLNAAWATPFDPARTQTNSFRLLSGDNVYATFFSTSAQLRQTSASGYQAVELPLAGNGLQYLVVLPDEGMFYSIQRNFTAAWLNQVVAALSSTPVNLNLPAFSIETETHLPLGSVPTTIDVADFSALDGTKDLYVSSTLHRTKLAITEKGLNAGSATLIALDDAHPETWTNPETPPWSGGFSSVMYGGSPWFSPPYVEVTLGRPFFFAVRDSATGAILFLGQVVVPTRVNAGSYSYSSPVIAVIDNPI